MLPAETTRSSFVFKIILYFTAANLVVAALVIQFISDSPVEVVLLKERHTPEGYILQSTSVTCAPAAAANIAAYFGVVVNEKKMAALMGTTGDGTSFDDVISGMRKLGLQGTKVTRSRVFDLQIPALLIVDHEATGPASHAIVLLQANQDSVEIIDPLVGKRTLSVSVLSRVWHGKAITFVRDKNGLDVDQR